MKKFMIPVLLLTASSAFAVKPQNQSQSLATQTVTSTSTQVVTGCTTTNQNYAGETYNKFSPGDAFLLGRCLGATGWYSCYLGTVQTSSCVNSNTLREYYCGTQNGAPTVLSRDVACNTSKGCVAAATLNSQNSGACSGLALDDTLPKVVINNANSVTVTLTYGGYAPISYNMASFFIGSVDASQIASVSATEDGLPIDPSSIAMGAQLVYNIRTYTNPSVSHEYVVTVCDWAHHCGSSAPLRSIVQNVRY